MSEHLGGDKDDYDAINSGKAIDGNRDAWDVAQLLANSGLGSQAQYDGLKDYVDMSSMIDFFLVNQYGNNTDWDFKNWYAGRERIPGAGFQFFSWDAEQTMASPNGSRIGMHPWLSSKIAEEYAMTSDHDNRWRTGGSLAEVKVEAHLDADHILAGIRKFAAERETRLGRMELR